MVLNNKWFNGSQYSMVKCVLETYVDNAGVSQYKVDNAGVGCSQ